jgi:UDP-2,3-diacylglucosamine pyrophosphatase LpxH
MSSIPEHLIKAFNRGGFRVPDTLEEAIRSAANIMIEDQFIIDGLKQKLIPDGFKLLKDTSMDERSWHEDAIAGSNYSHECAECGRMFLGHKHRFTCRACPKVDQDE